MLKRLGLFAFPMLCGTSLGAALAGTVGDLRCECRDGPLNVDVGAPQLSWIYSAPERGARQTAYQVLVASSPKALAADTGDLWDSGKVAAPPNAIRVPYAGQLLRSGQACYWKVRGWDQSDHPSAWSEAATWSMGLLAPSDWAGKWIAAPGMLAGASSDGALGYHAAVTDDPDATKWVQVDLGRPVPIDAVTLHTLNHEVPGFGFPIRFAIAASDDPAFTASQTIADRTRADVPNPGVAAVTFRAKGNTARYVRVTATRLFRRTAGDHTCCFALAELQVFSNGHNVALHAPVTAEDSVEDYGWGASELTDGLGLAPDAVANGEGPAVRTLPIFRRSFAVAQPVSRAVAYVCGLGQYELHLNGRRVGDAVLEPGWTNYRKTCLYQAYDVTAQLQPGENVIGVMLGNGMYNVAATPGRYTKFTGSAGQPKVIAQLDVTYADGTHQTIATDPSWTVAGGPITFSSIYGGEDYDARLDQPAWDARGGGATAGWLPAVEIEGPGGRLMGSSRSALPITVAAVLTARHPTHPSPDAWVYDLGQNCAMMPAITVSGRAGATVRLTPGEVLHPDGTVSQEPSGGPTYFAYTCKGGPSETWAPRFTYVGARYVQVSGAVPAGAPNPDRLPVVSDLHGLFVTSSSPIVGEFSCSNPLFNRTANIIRWSMRNNMMSILTDCPHRERLGWLEQVHLVGPSLAYNFDASTLFAKTCADMGDAQLDGGLVPDIAPEYAVFSGGFRDSPEWGSASVLIPWQVYQWYGDRAVLARSYGMMKRYVDYLGAGAKGHILSHGLGDWYDLGPKPPGYAQLTPIALTATAFYYRDLTILQKAAAVLGHDDDATAYAELGRAAREAFNAALYHPASHSYATGSQTANAIPLVMGLAPEADRAALLDNIVRDVRGRHNGLTSGDIGYRYLLRALADGGRSDVIFDMNCRSDRPGYGMILAKGATALTEAWDARRDSSQDHFMLGHIMEWFYGDLAGIRCDPSAVAFETIDVRPTPVGDVTWAKASYASASGTIQCAWHLADGAFFLDLVIPAGTTADVRPPKGFGGGPVTESGKPLVASKDISVGLGTPGEPSFGVAAGTYHFVFPALRRNR
jgi:alpha-L-rhamnosidase